MVQMDPNTLGWMNFAPEILTVKYTPNLVGLEYRDGLWNWLSRQELQATSDMLQREELPAAHFEPPYEENGERPGYVLTLADIHLLLRNWF